MFGLFLVTLVVGFIWDIFATFLILWIFGMVGIPVLDALTFWQVFGLLIVTSLATTKINSSSD